MPTPDLRSRAAPLLACVLTLTAGLVVHASGGLPFSDKLGDLLYAALVVFGLWFLRPATTPTLVATVAGTWCLAVELLQLTGVPAAAADTLPVSRLVLGSGFDPLDLAAYALGIVLALVVRHVAGGQTLSVEPASRPCA